MNNNEHSIIIKILSWTIIVLMFIGSLIYPIIKKNKKLIFQGFLFYLFMKFFKRK